MSVYGFRMHGALVNKYAPERFISSPHPRRRKPRLMRLGQRVTERQVRKDLEALRILGLAQKTGHGRGSRWRLS
jgi:hypothetical protein